MNDFVFYTQPDELFIKAATYQYPERLPVKIGVLPETFIKYKDGLKEVLAKHEDLLGGWWRDYDPYEHMPRRFRKGQWTDEWGCVWSNGYEGHDSLVSGHPVKTRADVHAMKAPGGDFGLPHGFMYLRLLDLRGFEEAMIDFAEEPPELQTLIDKVLNYNLRQVKLALEKSTDKMVVFADDLGMQSGLAIGAGKWRKYMKPCYAAMYKPCKDDGRLIFMHTDGCIHEIIPDLRECGVDMINPQFRANGLDNLERVCKRNRIPVCLDFDRQLFPFGTPSDMRAHVRECVERLYLPEGGLALNLEIGGEEPLENIDALLGAVNEYRFYKG